MLLDLGLRSPVEQGDPPDVPLLPEVQRTELGHFSISWEASEDDHTASGDILYEIGIIEADYCIVTRPNHRLRGDTSWEIALPVGADESPFVGFAVRALDGGEQSRGYGHCGWALRAPLLSPIRFPYRIPRLRPTDTHGHLARVCQSDGDVGAWCVTDDQAAHFANGRWESFPLPRLNPDFDWVALDDIHALVQSGGVQYRLSRANGTQATILGPGNQQFHGDGGAIAVRPGRAYLNLNGFVGEFRLSHIDMAGPPRALQLPDACGRIEQIGRRDQAAFAACQTADGLIVFLGSVEGEVIRWMDPLAVAGDRVVDIVGELDDGMIAVSDAETAYLYSFWAGQQTEISLNAMPGSGRPTVALSGNGSEPFAVFRRGSELSVYDGEQFHRLARHGDEVEWGTLRFPHTSYLVGTDLGVLAIHERGVVRLDRAGAEVLLTHRNELRGLRGLDSRRYVLRGPVLDDVLSSVDGLEWYQHGWRERDFEPVGLAVSRAGAIYLSGWQPNPDQPTGRDVRVVRLGAPHRVLGTPPADFDRPPILAVDDLGRLYAYGANKLFVYTPASDSWSDGVPIPGGVERLVGVGDAALVVGEWGGAPTLHRCTGQQCFSLPVPDAVNQPFTAAFHHGSGFCLGVASRALWCREGDEDTWVAPADSDGQLEGYGLGSDDVWRIRDGVIDQEGRWLLAIETGETGLIAAVELDGATSLLATGIQWAAGEVLFEPRWDGSVVALEREGPVRIALGGERVSVPGRLY